MHEGLIPLAQSCGPETIPSFHQNLFAVCIPGTWAGRDEIINQALPSVLRSALQPFEIVVAISGVPTLADKEMWERTLRGRIPSTVKLAVVAERTLRHVGWARNAAASVATAPWLVHLDSDDEMHPLRLNATHEVITKHPMVQLIVHTFSSMESVITDYGIEDGSRLIQWNNAPVKNPGACKTLWEGFGRSHIKIHHAHPTILRSLMWEHRYDEGLPRCEDTHFMQMIVRELGEPNKIALMKAPFSVYVSRAERAKEDERAGLDV